MIGDLIREERKARGYSPQEFVEKMGISRQQLYAWETNKASPKWESIKKLCSMFGEKFILYALLNDELEAD